MQQRPYLNTRDDGGYRFMGVPTVTRAAGETTNGLLAVIEHWNMPVGFGSPYHTHHREDESFYVLEGSVAIVCNGEWQKAGPGDFVYGPREIAHGFTVIGERPARMIVMCTPAGFERFIMDQATPLAEAPPSSPDKERMMMLADRHDIDIHGPLPELPAQFRR
jgi:mannose-6-phosphate isomerase-like protein (cupin superfamily)